MSANFQVRKEALTEPDVLNLIRLHLEEMYQWSPAEKVHALPIDKLREPGVTFFTARDDNRLAAIGALKQIDQNRGELKAMRADPAYRGNGAGEALLLHLMEVARSRGYSWLGLETGRDGPFKPAVSLYRKHGFSECEAFADYAPDEFSQCMSREL